MFVCFLCKALILNIFGFRNRHVLQGKGTSKLENVFKLRLQKCCSAYFNYLNSAVYKEFSVRFLNSTVAVVAAVDIDLGLLSQVNLEMHCTIFKNCIDNLFVFYASFGDILHYHNKYRIPLISARPQTGAAL